MKVIAVERGNRPATLTKARAVAPQAAKVLGSLLEDHVFADSAIIMIDWNGDFAWGGDGPMPEDLKMPIMFIATEKWYPQWSERLTLDYVLDLEDFFGADEATSDDLHQIVANLHARALEMEQKKGST